MRPRLYALGVTVPEYEPAPGKPALLMDHTENDWWSDEPERDEGSWWFVVVVALVGSKWTCRHVESGLHVDAVPEALHVEHMDLLAAVIKS